MALLSGGAFVSQIVQAISTPVLSRLYSPGAFGNWALIQSVAIIGSSVGGCRYDLAIVLAETDAEAAQILVAQTICNVTTSLILLCGVLLVGSRIAIGIGAPGMATWLYAVPAVVVLTGAGQAATGWLIRTQQYRWLAQFRVAQAAAAATIQVAIAIPTHHAAAGLIAGSLLSQLTVFWVVSVELRKPGVRTAMCAVTVRSIRAAAFRHRKFPLYGVPYGLVSVGRERGVVVLLGRFAAAQVVGFYSLSVRLVAVPTGLVVGSLSSVLYQHAAAEASVQNVRDLVRGALLRMVQFATPAFVLLAWTAPALFSMLLGARWREAGVVAAIMCPPAYGMLLTGWLDRLFDVTGRQRTALALEATYSVLAIALFSLVLSRTHHVLPALASFSTITFAYQMIWAVAIYRVCRLPLSDLVRLAVVMVASATASGAALWCITLVAPTALATVIAIAVLLAYYGTILAPRMRSVTV